MQFRSKKDGSHFPLGGKGVSAENFHNLSSQEAVRKSVASLNSTNEDMQRTGTDYGVYWDKLTEKDRQKILRNELPINIRLTSGMYAKEKWLQMPSMIREILIKTRPGHPDNSFNIDEYERIKESALTEPRTVIYVNVHGKEALLNKSILGGTFLTAQAFFNRQTDSKYR